MSLLYWITVENYKFKKQRITISSWRHQSQDQMELCPSACIETPKFLMLLAVVVYSCLFWDGYLTVWPWIHCVFHTGLRLMILWPLSSEGWDYNPVPSCLAETLTIIWLHLGKEHLRELNAVFSVEPWSTRSSAVPGTSRETRGLCECVLEWTQKRDPVRTCDQEVTTRR